MSATSSASPLEDQLRWLLNCDLRTEAPNHVDDVVELVGAQLGESPSDDDVRRALCPQWVVLAAGRGSRIDPTGTMNKLLDIWFGSRNVLQLACRHLIGRRPPIVVLGPDGVARVLPGQSPEGAAREAGVVPAEMLDPDALQRVLVPHAQVVLQPVTNGPGGAVLATEAALADSEADLVAVVYGDEPFLDRRMFVETWVAHVLAGADGTLCGKRPETVVDKGGMFFDGEGRFSGTKEWYDMSADEQAQMWDALRRGEAMTNAGISVFRRAAVLRRLDRLWLHKGGTEYHHTDLFHLLHEDGLRTHAHLYEGEVRSGVNRWANVLEGEAALYDEARRELTDARVRVDPQARVTLGAAVDGMVEAGRLEPASAFVGQVYVGADSSVGRYSHVEDSRLSGDVRLEARARVERSELHHVRVASDDVSAPVSLPGRGLIPSTEIVDCSLRQVVVCEGAQLRDVTASHTVIPPNLTAASRRLGIRRDPGLGVPHDGVPALVELVGEDYIPGAFTFAEKRGEPDWERLREHVRRAVSDQIAPRATSDPTARRVLLRSTDELLDAEFAGQHLVDDMTPEEVWQVLFELTELVTGNPDAYRCEKLRSRAAAFELAEQVQIGRLEWPGLLRVDVAANLIDFTSARMVQRLHAEPHWLSKCIREAPDAELAVDSSGRFLDMVTTGPPREILWLSDNDGETVFDLHVVARLLDEGHAVTMAGKAAAASNDATAADLRAATGHAALSEIAGASDDGRFRIIASGSRTAGTNLYDATPEFLHALRECDCVISKGQGNWYTTQHLRRDTFHLLLSKGMTAERTTGIVAPDSETVGGLIVAFVPRDSSWDGQLRDFAVTS